MERKDGKTKLKFDYLSKNTQWLGEILPTPEETYKRLMKLILNSANLK